LCPERPIAHPWADFACILQNAEIAKWWPMIKAANVKVE
jgi:hypothetical protein